MKNPLFLPDHIRPGVQVLFVGINLGLRSAEVGHHFAGYSNRFWKLLFDAKLVPLPLIFKDDCAISPITTPTLVENGVISLKIQD